LTSEEENWRRTGRELEENWKRAGRELEEKRGCLGIAHGKRCSLIVLR
jgi:hypothetical protein